MLSLLRKEFSPEDVQATLQEWVKTSLNDGQSIQDLAADIIAGKVKPPKTPKGFDLIIGMQVDGYDFIEHKKFVGRGISGYATNYGSVPRTGRSIHVIARKDFRGAGMGEKVAFREISDKHSSDFYPNGHMQTLVPLSLNFGKVTALGIGLQGRKKGEAAFVTYSKARGQIRVL